MFSRGAFLTEKAKTNIPTESMLKRFDVGSKKKIKIMFHVLWVLPPGFSQNFPKSQSFANRLYEEAWNFSKSQSLYGEGEGRARELF